MLDIMLYRMAIKNRNATIDNFQAKTE